MICVFGKYRWATVAVALLATPVWAHRIDAVYTDESRVCDPNTTYIGQRAYELGTGFPPDELIRSADSTTGTIACPTDGATFAVQVSITNLTSFSFGNLWYVADPETTIRNVDGKINSGLAFSIDAVGSNQPLISESGVVNNRFDPGETWIFIIDGYSNSLGLLPSALGSVGAGTQSLGDSLSSGSIVATSCEVDCPPLPVPPTGFLVALGLGGMAFARRRRWSAWLNSASPRAS